MLISSFAKSSSVKLNYYLFQEFMQGVEFIKNGKIINYFHFLYNKDNGVILISKDGGQGIWDR